MIDCSGDRICEGINKFARGVNPMVSVSYQNTGNAGINGSATVQSSLPQAKLPHRIMSDGAFRPPILRQEDLLPLSRLPRPVTSYSGTAEKIIYTKRVNPDIVNEIRKTITCTSAKPTSTYNLEKPVIISAKQTIKDPITITVKSEKHANDPSVKIVGTPIAEILDPVHYSVTAHSTADIHRRAFAPDATFCKDRMKHSLNPSVSSSKDKQGGVTYIHEDLSLSKNTPSHSAYTNMTKPGEIIEHGNCRPLSKNTPLTSYNINHASSMCEVDNTSHNYDRLREKPCPGGFNGAGVMPTFDRTVPSYSLNTKKATILQQANVIGSRQY
jgi:hypothetical protein